MKQALENDPDHKECLFDFCGNHRNPGMWADLWEDGSVSLGGGWLFYLDIPDDKEPPSRYEGAKAKELEALLRADDMKAVYKWLKAQMPA